MLSFTAVHTLTTCLIAADADADTMGWGQPLTLLLIHDQPTAGKQWLREMRGVAFPLRRDDLPVDAAGLPALLRYLAEALHGPAGTPYRATLATILGRIHATAPDARVLAWAVCYDDVDTVGGPPWAVRRIEAVDVDGRGYRLIHLAGQEHPLLLVDDTPDPEDMPTGPGLAALLTATHRSSAAMGGGTA